ncbi:type II secretion system F family protein [Trinickia dinghuensis]|uniref:Pilus assembly protein TadB n=1 Tax=Trinickia dinghuensis TaxID=2291023 RepID=A0A3D8K0F5_9BURK|nr:type II secretion system F family protein [Trinickia dinghuensis]RDU98610.1 pilus assembly protein TadB [Trinickia dinghuensis]
MDSIFYAFIVLMFVAVVLAFEAIYIWWNSRHGAAAKRIDSRIRALSAGGNVNKERLSILKDNMLKEATLFEKLMMQLPRAKSLDLLLQQSGTHTTVARLGFTSLIMGLGVLAVTAILPVPLPVVVAPVAALIAGALPYLNVMRKRSKRLHKLEKQLPDVADTMSRALRAGHSFASAVGMVSAEFPEPMGGEFRITFDEINYGVPLNEALLNLANRVPIRDLRYFVIAVLIQRETGGNLAEVLDGIGFLIRERFKLFDKVRVLAAEGKLSAWVLSLLPLVTGGAVMIFNPKFLPVLWEDPLGQKMLGGMVVIMLMGILWMRKIIKIRV